MLPNDYEEKVYAGLLGKVIGVYLGRPIENWPYELVQQVFGEVDYYVHDKLGKDLIVTDDDISGTLTFLRALEDYDFPAELKPEMVGQTWLNYLIPERSVIAWAGFGNLPAPTAYRRLQQGIKPPESGSAKLNTKELSEQIGSQIFVDGWAMVSPGNPERAVEFARKASCVAFDGEAIYGAQVWAALESMAFVENDIDKLIDTAVSFIPQDSAIFRVIANIRGIHAREADWRKAREFLNEHFGYHIYGGACHIVPNHGLMMLSLLYGQDSFHRTMMIVNSAGWDTDCNAGNLGCLLGIKNGLKGLEEGPDWRGPVCDRIFISTADGGQAVNDVLNEAYHIVNMGRRLEGLPVVSPKNGARYHFEMPGAVQGFRVDETADTRGTLTLENVEGHSLEGSRSLGLRYKRLARGRKARAFVDVFIPFEVLDHLEEFPYPLDASPAVYEGQTLRARLSACDANKEPVSCQFYLTAYDPCDQPFRYDLTQVTLDPGSEQEIACKLQGLNGLPIYQIGVELSHESYETSTTGSVYLDYMTWEGEPDTTFRKPDALRNGIQQGPTANKGIMWYRAWTNALEKRISPDLFRESFRLIQNNDRGMMIIGSKKWRNYRASADVSIYLARSAGIAVRVQGLKRFYALLMDTDGKLRLIKALDGDRLLAQKAFPFTANHPYQLALEVSFRTIRAYVGGDLVFECVDEDPITLDCGGVALICEEGRSSTEGVTVSPLENC